MYHHKAPDSEFCCQLESYTHVLYCNTFFTGITSLNFCTEIFVDDLHCTQYCKIIDSNEVDIRSFLPDKIYSPRPQRLKEFIFVSLVILKSTEIEVGVYSLTIYVKCDLIVCQTKYFSYRSILCLTDTPRKM